MGQCRLWLDPFCNISLVGTHGLCWWCLGLLWECVIVLKESQAFSPTSWIHSLHWYKVNIFCFLCMLNAMFTMSLVYNITYYYINCIVCWYILVSSCAKLMLTNAICWPCLTLSDLQVIWWSCDLLNVKVRWSESRIFRMIYDMWIIIIMN